MNKINSFAALCLATIPLAVMAHDTWFVPETETNVYFLNTGSHFPYSGSAVPHEFVQANGCTNDQGDMVGKSFEGSNEQFQMRVSFSPHAATTSCWAALRRTEITLEPAQVKQYLNETKAAPNWTDFYASLLKENEQWVESYRKSARIELQALLSSTELNLPFQARLSPDSPESKGLVGKPLKLQILLNGKPLENQPLEFIVDSAPFGIWYETDAKGEIEITPPFPGQALLRGTHFSLRNGKVHTEFLTYSFVVNP